MHTQCTGSANGWVVGSSGLSTVLHTASTEPTPLCSLFDSALSLFALRFVSGLDQGLEAFETIVGSSLCNAHNKLTSPGSTSRSQKSQ